MSSFRRVFGERAGPTALSILVPPGRRTVLILRPRALAWDLILIQPGSGAFMELAHDEAEAAAETLCRALEAWGDGGPGQVAALPLSGGEGHCVRAQVGEFPLLACPRRPGQPYQPMVFASLDEARDAATAIASVL